MLRTAFAAKYLRPWPSLATLLLAAWSSGIQVSSAADLDIIRIEEDWEMVVNEPAPSTHSPQVTFFLAPAGGNSDCHFEFQLNHAIESGFSGGGFHLAAVQGARQLDGMRSSTYQPLISGDQSVSWTSVMVVSDSNLFFCVKDGYCEDWGAFGGPESTVQMGAGGITNLNGYSPARSLKTIDIGFGGNRIQSLVLKNVRLYYTDGSVSQVSVNCSPALKGLTGE